MGFAKLLFKALTSRTNTDDYAVLLNRTLETFRVDLEAGEQLLQELKLIDSPQAMDIWGQKYSQWQSQTLHGKELKRQLVASRPKDRHLVKLHNGLVVLMNNRNIEQTQTFNMFIRSWHNNNPGANEARDAANRAEREGDAALDFWRKQLASLQRENAQLLDSLNLPTWVLEM